jgi:lipopolysaccharide transport system ATP-binding protein
MSSPIIRVENLGKKYTIRHQGGGPRYRRLSEDIVAAIKRPFRRRSSEFRDQRSEVSPPTSDLRPPASDLRPPTSESFWALRNVSFDVQQGEVVGIIGRNGAGKSTLLKILSRITEPSEGRVTIRGRVASLLEVGTGFHPELTGRENVYLNGAVLGMSRVEIKRKFDEIVAFAEVEKFLDTPVKHYSSGMYVRLAFAVAAHLEPEILIVDEVLAVGDAQFQKRCLGKMQSVATNEGRTVLFVSHQIPAVTRLCQSVIWLDRGQVQESGQCSLVCSRYLANGLQASARRDWSDLRSAPGNDWVRLESVEALSDGRPASDLDIRCPLEIRITYRVLRGGKVLIPNIHLYSEDGTVMFILHDWHSGWRTKPKLTGRYRTSFDIPGNFFNEGRIVVKVVATTYQPYQVHFDEPDAIALTVIDATEGVTARGDYAGHIPGVIRPMFESLTEMI